MRIKQRKSISIDPDLWEAAHKEAKRLDCSVSYVICKALKKHVREMAKLERLRGGHE